MNNNPNAESGASQCNKIKEWLNAGKTITSMEAITLFGCGRLASRINDLRNRGMNITTDMIVTPNGKHVARYSLSNN